MNLSPKEKLALIEAEAARLKRIIASGSCAAGHTWVSVGGANAGCDDWCACSIPVYVCEVCGDSDYGDNAEAKEIICKCREEGPAQ